VKKQPYLTASKSAKPVIAIAIGSFISLGVTFLLSMILASMVSSGKIPPEAIGSTVWPVQFISCTMGCIVATAMAGNMPAIVSAVSAAVYLFALLAGNILLMNGNMKGIGSGIFAILCGAFVPIAIRLFRQRGRGTSR